ncbi:MAG: T9SS type A sorting domain-containing protein [Ignavibacteria bacterium]|nr:T9SS type A sorting domain-containing protein [Ignavibacteria bacterium]
MFLIAAPTGNAQPPTDGLVGFWPFSGGTSDESGQGADAALLGGAKAIYILAIGDNGADALSVPAEVVDGLTSFTLSAWIRINTLHSQQPSSANSLFSGRSDGYPKAFVLRYHAGGGQWRIRMTQTEIIIGNRAIEDGGWHHVAVSRNGNLVRFFLDGALLGSGTVLPTDLMVIDQGGFVVGQTHAIAGGYEPGLSLAGGVDNLRIYNTALDLGQVGELVAEGYSQPEYSVTISADSVFVPADGAVVLYHLTIVNETAETQHAEYWTRLVNPDGSTTTGPFGQGEFKVDPFETITRRSSGTFTDDDKPGTYLLSCLVGVNGVDTLAIGETTIQKLAVPCSAIDLFRARCEESGLLRVQALMPGTQYGGEEMFFDVNGTIYPVTVQSNASNSKAILQLADLPPGGYTVSLLPQGCYGPLFIQCGAARTGIPSVAGIEDGTALVGADPELPVQTRLIGNYPNPFNATTRFAFDLAEQAEVSIRVYDLLGREVATVASGPFGAGSHTAQWHATSLPSGMYLYRFTAGPYQTVSRLLLLK